MNWEIPKIWENEEVWILGGGPSIASSFGIPDKLVTQVRQRIKPMSVYAKYFKRLKTKHIIGINVAYKIADWIDIIFVGDKGFLLQHKQGLKDYAGMIISCHSIANKEENNWVKYVPKNNNELFGISPHPWKISWNLNSGAAAIDLAIKLGAKRVILLGFDMSMEEGRTHFHDEYKQGFVTKDDVSNRKVALPYQRHLECFPRIKMQADKLGVEIINTSMESVITEFEKIPVSKLL